jgi:peptide/nickel transport system substrate-binding protein
MTAPDPQYFMNQFCSWEASQKANKWQGRNVTRFKSDEYDRLYKQADGEIDPVKRAALFIRMNDIVVQKGVVIPLAQRAKGAALASRLRGVETNAFDLDFWNIASWYREG